MVMQIQQNVPLNAHSTMRVGGLAAYLTEVTRASELKEVWDWAKQQNLPVIMIGDGSNIIWKDEGFPGLVIVNKILGYDLSPFDEHTASLTLGAGEPWDSVVARTVQSGYWTLAPLSLIPGRAGATPVQNVGAYGMEVKDCLMTVQAFDTSIGQQVILPASDCGFSYRSSIFKTTEKGRYLITGLTFSLTNIPPLRPFYEAIERYLREKQLDIQTPQQLRDAVVAIRSSKLPDPAQIGNNGSFFANPIISDEQLVQVLGVNDSAKYWHLDGGKVKLSAAWLMENAGFKDFHDQETGMATWPLQTLVVVNEKAPSAAAVLAFKEKIVQAVKTKFDITLEQEPELLP